MVSYNLDSITEIRDNLDTFVLEKETQTIIDALIILLGLNVQTKTKVIKRDNSRNSTDKNWGRKEEFKVTVMKKSEGVDEILNNLRGVLNKITIHNYEVQSEKVCEIINELINFHDEHLNDLIKYEKIIECLFKIIINNRVYANIYAKLFSELLDKYILLDEYRNYFLEKYEEKLSDIIYVDPDKDYDQFCSINKQNEHRKSLLTFLVHSIPTEVYSFEDVKISLNILFEKIEHNKGNKSEININEEILENIFVIFSEGRDILNKEVSKYEILNKITNYTNYKVADYPGFSSRMRFKCMDILELYTPLNI